MTSSLDFFRVNTYDQIPTWITEAEIIDYFHETMKPFEDKPEDIKKALDYAFNPGRGGFLMLARSDNKLAGALLMLKTGMSGYVPEYILLFVTISPDLRGLGIGKQLIEHCIDQCDGDVKLHVECENPAKRLYERIGFTNDYTEMRYKK